MKGVKDWWLNGQLLHSLRQPPPSPGVSCSGTRVDADVAALQPPERRRPTRLLLFLLSALSLEQIREEEDERRREKKIEKIPLESIVFWMATYGISRIG
uniref:Uncharacterized protein n=1 Tax=Oryza rufipogon TaxID=4529 RepID=A0A0E0P4I8_ORYRU